MDELLQQVLGYLRAMWHRRWYGLAAAWLAAIIGVIVVYRIPNKYEASARVYVDTESLLRPLLGALAVQPNVDQQVGLISRTLLSRPNVENDMHARPSTPQLVPQLLVNQTRELVASIWSNSNSWPPRT